MKSNLSDSMVIKRTALKLVFSFVIASLLLSMLRSSAFACTPPPITPWFTEQLSFVETNLPASVSHPSELNFINTGGSPFYFMYQDELKDMGDQIQFGISVYEDNDFIDVNNDAFFDFEHRNKIGDNRPENTQPPDHQDVSVPVILTGKQYEIKLRIAYEINRYYDPKSVEAQNVNCPYEEMSYNFFSVYCLNPFLIGIIILATLGIVVIIVKGRSSVKSIE